MLSSAVLSLVSVLVTGAAASPQGLVKGDYPIQPAPFTSVHIDDGFWSPRLETSRNVTVPYCFTKCEETGRIDNFDKAAGMMEGTFEGIYFNDSDVVKVVEGAAYTLALGDDPELDAYLDDLITKIAGAQEDDGYLYTARTIDPANAPEGCGPERWSRLQNNHELYNIGHMYEAAVAHYQATGKRTLLDVAIKSADLIDSVFGPDKRRDVPGHQEIEIGLVRLYRVTGNERYLRLAKFFLDERGHANGRELYGENLQDHKPVVEQDEAVGHAVRAGYMYSGMADVAALTGDEAYMAALDKIWTNIISKKMYLTGGVGSSRHGEAFGANYELPNGTAYNETCAAIANAFFNYRMFLLYGDAKYVDVFERTLYNGFLAGVSLEGNTFFYPNPLSCDGITPFNHGSLVRQEWFGCSCCPVNVARFVPSLAGYVYAVQDDALYVNLFMGGQGEVNVADNTVALVQQTNYPWDGDVMIAVEPKAPAEFTVSIRVPGWAQGQPVPSDLYAYPDPQSEPVRVAVNGAPQDVPLEKGYLPIRRMWRAGDIVQVHLPMPVRRVLAHENVEADRGRVALERGPLVYCAEAIDNNGYVRNLLLPDDAPLTTEHRDDLLGGVTVVKGEAGALQKDGGVAQATFAAVPYYAWAHRGSGEMAVWLARTQDVAEAAPEPTLAGTSVPSASHANAGDSLAAMKDQVEPAHSNDQGIPRFTWWDHRGGTEWVQYDFKAPAAVSAVEVYWFDDTGQGQCRVPASWRLLYKDSGDWKPVQAKDDYSVARDAYNRVEFQPVTTQSIRVEAILQPDFSGGILEWRVLE